MPARGAQVSATVGPVDGHHEVVTASTNEAKDSLQQTLIHRGLFVPNGRLMSAASPLELRCNTPAPTFHGSQYCGDSRHRTLTQTTVPQLKTHRTAKQNRRYPDTTERPYLNSNDRTSNQSDSTPTQRARYFNARHTVP